MSRMIPRGHDVAGLGRRFLAWLIDVVPVAVMAGLLTVLLRLWGDNPTVVLVASIACGVVVLGYGLYQWWAYASKEAGLGAMAMNLQLVGLADGKPIGWWRVFLRFLVYLGLMLTVVGGIALVVFLIVHERRQGWHDMAVKAVVVQPKNAVVAERASSRSTRSRVSTVGLPPHLAEEFSPEASTYVNATWGPSRGGQPRQPQEPWRSPEPMWGQQPAQGWGAQAKEQPPSVQPSAAQTSLPPRTQPYPNTQISPSAYPGPVPRPVSATPNPVSPAHPTSDTGAPQVPPARRSTHPTWIPMPTPSSVLEPSHRSVKVRQRQFGEVDDDDSTRIAPLPHTTDGRPGDEGWYLRLDDGREVDLAVTVLLGRNPQRELNDPEVQLVPASGDGRMISRTHVLIGTDPRGVFVMDRGSTNGTALITPSGEYEPVPEGVQVRVHENQQVNYGNRWFTVRRRPVV